MSVQAAINYICQHPNLIPQPNSANDSSLSTQGPCQSVNSSGFCAHNGNSFGFTRTEYFSAISLFRQSPASPATSHSFCSPRISQGTEVTIGIFLAAMLLLAGPAMIFAAQTHLTMPNVLSPTSVPDA